MVDKYYTQEVRDIVRRTSRRYENDLADILSRVFAAGVAKYELAVYIDAVMQSEVMAEFDMPISEYHWCGPMKMAYLIEEELAETGKIPPAAPAAQIKNLKGAEAIADWGAYLYLRMHVSYGLSSGEANKIISGGNIVDAWYAYHTYDLDEAIAQMTCMIDHPLLQPLLQERDI